MVRILRKPLVAAGETGASSVDHRSTRPADRGLEVASSRGIRICGSSEDMLRNWDAREYRSDAVEVSVAEILKRSGR